MAAQAVEATAVTTTADYPATARTPRGRDEPPALPDLEESSDGNESDERPALEASDQEDDDIMAGDDGDSLE